MIKPFPRLNFWASVEAELDSTVATVDFEDLSANAFGVTISRVQQEALKAASCRVPTPSEQLALVAERREKKNTLTHDWNTHRFFFTLHMFHLGGYLIIPFTNTPSC